MSENLNLQTVETVDTRPFRKLVMTIGELPTSFVESMTYYELLAWFTNYLETVIIPTVNNNAECVEELQEKFIILKNTTEKEIGDFETHITALFNELHDYVENYFDNLDVQEEINNKLDDMVEAGTLQEIIGAYLNATAIWCFDNVAGMKVSTNLIDGSFARTLGYYTRNDFGGATYKIREMTNSDVVDDATIIAIGSGTLVAELMAGEIVNVNQFGAYGDGTHNDAVAIQKAISYINAKMIIFEQANPNEDWHRYFATSMQLYFPSSQYLINDRIEFNGSRYYNIHGNKSIIKCDSEMTDPVFYFSGTNGTKCDISGFIFKEMANAIEYNATNNDMSHVMIDSCDFVGITNIAIKYENRSCMLKVQNCNFSWCYKIFKNIKCDCAEFENCWFSEYEANENGYTSFELLWGENKFINCFFIPNGNYNPSVDQSTLTDLAWMQVGDGTSAVANNPSVLMDRCRASAETNSKTMINWKVVPNTGNSPTDTYIKILNCYAMACVLGACVIRAWHVPQQVIFENTEISNESAAFIKFVDGVNINNDITTYFSGANRLRYTFNYGFKNVKTQTSTTWKTIPAELAPFVRYSDNDVRIPITASNKSAKYFLGDTTLSTPYYFNKMFLVKAYFFAVNGVSSLSSITGIVMFDAVNTTVESNASIRVKFVKLGEYAGGSSDSSAQTLNITPTFNDTNSSVITMSSHQNLTLTLTIDNTIFSPTGTDGEAFISIKEL